MKKIPWVMFVYIVLITGQTLALEITSLAPVRGTPGTLVGISGGPFSTQTQPFLGEKYVAPRITLNNEPLAKAHSIFRMFSKKHIKVELQR